MFRALASLWCVTLCVTAHADQRVDFVRDVQPILRRACGACHTGEKQEGGLRLDRRERALAGGDSGRVLTPGNSRDSLLMKYVRGDDPDIVMPPSGERLSAAEIQLLERWIDEGLAWPDSADEDEEASRHWAFRPVQRPPLPTGTTEVQHPLDAFIQAELQRRGWPSAPQASRETLIRRLYLDLLGLPPSTEAVEEFVHDEHPAAYERLVDRVLANPHLGERWGRHWLDLARYADSDGYEKDLPRPFAWRYRQWVIEAVNRDLPFDQFTIEQLAGDLLPNATLDQQIATGFHRQTLTNREGGADPREDRAKQLVDRTNTTGAVWLGLTVNCAQCHSHKYDPISQREYFQLYAFFEQAVEADIPAPTPWEQERYAQQLAAYQGRREPLAAQQAAIRAAVERTEAEGPVEASAAVHLVEVSAALARLDAQAPKPPSSKAMVLTAATSPPVTRIHRRGDFLQLGDEVQPDTIRVIPPRLSSEGLPNRLDLARWIVAPDNPLTRRVAVNRIWQHLFGRGLVDPPDDFGVRGSPPTHPALLDWLAEEFLYRQWSRKSLIRLIVTSATYQRSSVVLPELLAVDPKNDYLARQHRYRLEGEIVRDLTLQISGLLDDRLGGESVRPPLPAGVAELGYAGSVKWPESSGGDRYRRGCYIFFQRTVPYPLLMTFDSPDSNVSCARRERSNTPLQSLTLLNDPTFFECARAFGHRLIHDQASTSPSHLARVAFRRCLSREPDDEELALCATWYEQAREALRDQPAAVTAVLGRSDHHAADEAAAVLLARLLFNLEEFYTRE